MEDEEDATSSGNEWDGGDEDDVDDNIVEDEEDDEGTSDDVSDEDVSGPQRSLIVTLRYGKSSNLDTTDSAREHGAQDSAQRSTETTITTANPNPSVDGHAQQNLPALAASVRPNGVPLQPPQNPSSQFPVRPAVDQAHQSQAPPPITMPAAATKHISSLPHVRPAMQTPITSYMPATTYPPSQQYVPPKALPQNQPYPPANTYPPNQPYAPPAVHGANGTYAPPASYAPNPAYMPPASNWQ